ncbi:MAG: hypothetical protein K2P70_04565 [Hyphomonadaceae bacterium]|nr:hypothetical protein [Hyphomonadaceae bacterium]
MLKVIGFSAAALGLGWVLAWISINYGVSTGWIGAAVLLGWAVAARLRWERLKQHGADPSGPERVVWHRLASAAIGCGHMLTSLAHPSIDLHVGSGNSLATDSWTILAAIVVSALVFHGGDRERDERDRGFAAAGLRVSYTTLIVELLILLFFLGFAPPDLRAPFSHFFIANLLIALIVISALAQYLAQLIAYARDAQAAAGGEQ